LVQIFTVELLTIFIVLWEIISGQEPFPHMDSYGTFKRAITKENERPRKSTQVKFSKSTQVNALIAFISASINLSLAIPPETHPSIKALMEACWHPDPTRRPSFTQIIPILDSVLVDCLVDDPVANRFWKDNYLGHVTHYVTYN
jgi:hypothetical protein